VPTDDRRSGYYTHPGVSDYLELRKILKKLARERRAGVSTTPPPRGRG